MPIKTFNYERTAHFSHPAAKVGRKIERGIDRGLRRAATQRLRDRRMCPKEPMNHDIGVFWASVKRLLDDGVPLNRAVKRIQKALAPPGVDINSLFANVVNVEDLFNGKGIGK